ncbi:MAG: hypothetical protein Kow00120_24630 [Anaerolineae bacterium]
MSIGTETGTETLTITPLALQMVKEIQAERNLESYLLRVFVAGSGCSGVQYGLAFEEAAMEDDTVIKIDGLSMVVDAVSLPYVTGACIDFVDGPMGAGFRIDNPNAMPMGGSCSCGGGCSC